MGTKIGAKIAHFAEPELKNTSTRVTRIMKPMHMGIPVKPMLSRKSAPAMADHGSQVGPGEQALELSAEETEAHVGTHGSHLLHNGLMDIHQSLKVSGGIAVGNRLR